MTNSSFINTYGTIPQDTQKPTPRYDITCERYAVYNKEENFYVPLKCKKWSCPDCCEANNKDLRRRLEQSEANMWPIKSHIVLTVGGFDASRNIDEEFNHLMTDLKRGGTFTYKTVHGELKTVTLRARPHLKYIKVKEFQYERHEKFGIWYLHIHLVVNQYLTKYDIIPIWNHVTTCDFNYVEDTHPHNFNAGKYLAKYFTKYEYQAMFEKGERRYGCSRGVIPPKPIKVPSGLWEFMTLEQARELFELSKPEEMQNMIFLYGIQHGVKLKSNGSKPSGICFTECLINKPSICPYHNRGNCYYGT